MKSYSDDQIKRILESHEATEMAIKGANPEEMLKFYMDYKASINPLIAEVYPNNKDGKTIEDAIRYISDKARKLTKGNMAMIWHTEVFNWLEEYFIDENIKKIESPKPTPVAKSTTSTPKLSTSLLEITRKQYEDWQTTQKEKIDKWEKEHLEKIDKWCEQHQNELFFDPTQHPFVNEKNPHLEQINPFAEKLEQLEAEQNKNTKEDKQEIKPLSSEPVAIQVEHDPLDDSEKDDNDEDIPEFF